MKKQTRRILALLAVFLTVVLVGSPLVRAYAVPQVAFSLKTTAGAVGETVKVPLMIQNNCGISTFRFRVSYDSEALKYVSVSAGDDLTIGEFKSVHNSQDHTITFLWMNVSNDFSSDGVVANLQFEILSGINTESQLTISSDPDDVVNHNLQVVPFTVQNGKVLLKVAEIAPTVAPELLSASATSITVKEVAGYEYSIDGNTWQTSGTFNGLSPATSYVVQHRVAETELKYASNAGPYLKASTTKTDTDAPAEAPKVLQVTGSGVSVETKQGYEYSIDGVTWQTSGEFTDLNPVTSYNVYSRVAETATGNASPASPAVTITTDKATPDTPVPPAVESKTQDSVTLVAVPGYEYSLDGIHWQDSNVFENLSGNSFSFYQRVKGSETNYPSANSEATIVNRYLLGDVNDDGKVDDSDAIRVLYYTFFPEFYPVNQECDFNHDGVVNDQDAIYLLYYTFFPDFYPLT